MKSQADLSPVPLRKIGLNVEVDRIKRQLIHHQPSILESELRNAVRFTSSIIGQDMNMIACEEVFCQV